MAGSSCDILQLANRAVCTHMRAQAQALTDSATLGVDFDHLRAFDEELAGVVQREYYRVEPALRKAEQPYTSLLC